ncbi:MAG TPA: hypothetical protein VEV84_00270, partial [Pyrinomonadaceae bacterium]|nr:hypothetical protein [Pyrinomonadaceae bacterium]
MKKTQLLMVSTKAALVALALLFLLFDAGYSQPAQPEPITQAERLRGSITPEREWWDVQHYDLSVQFFPPTRSVKGSNVITFKTLKPGSRMQIDL